MAGSRQTISGASEGANFRRRVFGWLVKAVATALCLWLVLLAAGWVLRKLAIGQIVELTGAKVQARSVDVDLDGSVHIERLVVRPHQSQGGGDAILSADTVDARFGVWSVVFLRPRLKEIRVNSFVFDAQYDLDTGRWNTYAFKIKPPKEASGPMPVVRLEKGTLKYSKISKGLRQTVMAVPVDARFGPSDQPDKGYNFDVTTAAIADGLGQSRVHGFWKPGIVTIAGGVSSTDFAAFENVWNIYIVAGVLKYDRSGDYSMDLSLEDLKNTYKSSAEPAASRDARFLRKLGAFSALQGFFYRYRPQANLDIRLNAEGNLYRLGESTFSGSIDCRDVSICDRKFPYMVEHITGTIDFTQDSVTLNGLSGTHGDVNLRFNGFSKGLGAQRRFEMELTSPNMALDSDLFEALSGKNKRFWSAFSPQGQVAIRRRTANQPGGEKQVSVAVGLLGVDAVYSKFPYPLKNVTGKLLLDKDGVSFSDVVSEYDGRRIAVTGRVATADSQEPVYRVSVEAEDIPLDSTLGEALPEESKGFYSQLGMVGSADVRVRILTPADRGSSSYVATATLKQASLRLERLPREISDVSGQVVFTPNLIGIERLTGQYGSSLVSLNGRIEPGSGAENLPYSLSLQAEQLELNAELLDLLHPTAKQMISRFEPEGRVNLNVELGRSAKSEHTDYRVSVDCLRNSAGLHFTNGRHEGQAQSIVQFTYPLRDISGRLVVTPNSLAFDNITARTADKAGLAGQGSQVGIDGRLALENGSFSAGSLRFSAKDIELSERLATALPSGIGGVYLQLLPTGRFDLDFDKISIYTAEDGEKCVEYSGVTRFNNCSLSTVPSVSELDGVLETKGLYKFGSGFSQAEVLLSARRAKVERVVLENLEAKLLYDENRQRWRTDRFLADCYGGKVTGEFDLKRVADRSFDYEFQAGFQDVDLEQFLMEADEAGQEPNLQPQTTVTMAGVNAGSSRHEVREQTRDGRHTSGKVSGSLALAGRISALAAGGHRSASPPSQGHHSNSRVGSLRLKIADMRVGRMSPLDKVLCVLRLTEPQDYAFDEMIVDSYLKDDKIMFELMDLSGQAIAFKGSGEMSLPDRSIDLVFLARGSRLAQAEPSVFGSLTESLGSAVVRVDVTGDLYDPQVTTKTLPVIRDALEVFGAKPVNSDS